jgi:multiple sugar transport system substrate-binding protein
MGWAASPLETQAVKNGIAVFEKQNPGIKVTYTPTQSGDNYIAKVLAAIAGNSLPDVFFLASDTYRTVVSKGSLLDITDNFNASFPLEDFIQSSRTIMSVDGRIYGISSCTVSPVILYNKTIFDAVGEPYPSADPAKCWTIDEFRAVAKRLTKDGIWGCFGLEAEPMYNPQILSAGGSVYKDNYTRSALNTPEVKRVWETIKAIRVEDKTSPADSTLENAGMSARQMLATGKVAMLADGSYTMQEFSTLGFPVGIAPMPSYGKALTVGQAHLHVISKNTKHPAESWKFLTFLSGMDYQGQLCKEGLWLPNRYSMWEPGPNGIDGWYDEARLGPYYRQMRNYLRDAEVDPRAMQLSNRFRDIIREEADRYFKQNAPIEVCLANIEKRTDEEYAAMQRQK